MFCAMWKYFFIILCVLGHTQALLGEDIPKSSVQGQPPDPGDLTGDWWLYFNTPEAKTFGEHTLNYGEILKAVVTSLPENKRAEASSFAEKILNNLRSIESQLIKPLETPPSAPPFREVYSLDDIITLDRSIRRIELEIKNNQDLKAEQEKALDSYTSAFYKTLQQYNKEQPRSPTKTLLGLQVLENKTLIENTKLELKQLAAQINADATHISQLQDESDYAQDHLASSQSVLNRMKAELPRFEATWEQVHKQLREKESLATTLTSTQKNPVGAAESLLFQQELLEAEIQTAAAHAEYLQAQIKLPITQYFVNSSGMDISGLKVHAEQWEALVHQYQTRLNEWTEATQKSIQRLSQSLSLPVQDDAQSKAIRKLQEEALNKAQVNLLQIQRLDATLHDTEFLDRVLQEQVLSILGGKSWAAYMTEWVADTFGNLSTWLSKPLFTVGSTNINLLSILKLLVILLLVGWISRIITTTLSTLAAKRKGIQKSLIYRITRLIHYFMLALGLVIALASIGFDFSSFVLIAGALGVGLGFGLQSIFNNFISGLIILFESELNVGDFIELDNGVRGEIREIKVRNTIVTTNDGTDILIPNSQLINNRVTNWTLSDPYRSVRINFTVPHGTDKDLVVKIVKEVAKNASCTLNKIGTPEPKVFLTKLGDIGMEFTLVVWVNERSTKRTLASQSEYLWAIDTILKEYGIEMPIPHYDVRITDVLGNKNLGTVQSFLNIPPKND